MKMRLATNVKFKRMFVNILSIFVVLVMAFPATGIVSAQEPAPFIRISTSNDYLQADNFTPNAMVTFTVHASQDSSDVVLEISRQADQAGLVFIDGWEHSADLVAGNYVIATDGTIEKRIVLQPLRMDVFDPVTDLITGTATPGQSVWVLVGNNIIGYPAGMWVEADINGLWTADFSSVFDFTDEMWGGAVIYDEDGDFTVYHLGPPPPQPSPSLRAHPVWDSVDAWNWPQDATLHLTIDDPATGERPDLEMDMAGVVDPNLGSVWFEFAGTYDLKPGDLVTMTDGVTTRSLTVSILSIDTVDLEADTLSGTVEPLTQVRLPLTPNIEFFGVADSGGNWFADLRQISFDLTPGTTVIAEVFDEDGDNSSFELWIPNPRFTVFPEWEFFDGLDWPNGATVTITVAGKPECATSRESWDNFFNGNFGEGCNVEIGDLVTFTDGTTTRTHTVQNLAVTNVDVLANTVGGIADPGAVVDVWPHETGQQLQATAADGNWQVDFTGLFDLVPGTCGRSQIPDQAGNATAVDWCAPKPWLIAFPENEAVEGWEWPVGATVTLTIDNAPEGFERSGVAEVTTWGDPRTFIRFDLAGAYDLKIGDAVTLTGEDGATRTHIVQNLSVTDLSADADTVTGTANAGAVVTLWPHGHDQIATLQTTAGDGDAWLADFATVGFNLVPGIGGRSEVGDEAGNWTAVDWNVPMDGWQQVNDSGFGDPQTVGVTAVDVFHGQLYAGTSNGNAGGEVWRLGQDGQWMQVSDAGFGSGPANPSIIDLAVFQGKLYAGSGWNNEAPGQVWRSTDGTNWQPVTMDGFGIGENIAVTNFVVYKGMLYAGTGNVSGSAQIWRSSTGDSGSWIQVAPDEPGLVGNVTGFADYKGVLYAALEPAGGVGGPIQVWRSTNGSDWTTITDFGFGDSSNESTGGFAQFSGYLYLGTRNEATGAQLWRTLDGLHWEQVVGDGFGDLNNIKIESLLVYDDLLYAATYNAAMGLQLWRSADGMNWEQVTANGFGDSSNFSTLWNSATTEFQGEILIGTWNNVEGGELWMYTP